MCNDERDEQWGESGEHDPRDNEQGAMGAEFCDDAGEVCAQGGESVDGSAQEEDADVGLESRGGAGETGGGSVTAVCEAVGDRDADMVAQLAEAEQRGYLRGRNERIEELMSGPRLWQRDEQAEAADEVSEVLFLNDRRRSIWEMK